MRTCLVAVCLAALPSAGFAADSAPLAPRPLAELPYTPGVDLSALDRSVDPCQDFYAFACGGWKKNNPLPADQSRWSVYSKVQDENQQFLWGLLEQAARPGQKRSPAERRIGDYFAACMDEAAVERAGAKPLEPDLREISALVSVAQLGRLLGRLHGADDGGLLFGFGAEQDLKESTQVVAYATAGGLGLPDRDYYVKDDAKSQETRQKYVAQAEAMLRLLGDAPERAQAAARDVLRIETGLARASLTRVERRNPYKLYHKLTRAELQALTPSLPWDDYLAEAGLAQTSSLIVTEPEFFGQVEATLKGESLEALKGYLRWHLVRARAPYLSRAFVQGDFDFFRRYLRGQKEMRPRWKSCVQWVDRDLGEELGQAFVARTFPPETRANALHMVEQIEKAMQSRLYALPWMGDETRARALRKLHAMRNKIGYPDAWRDYSALGVARDDFHGNVERGVRFETRRQFGKIGRPIDRGEWGMTPPTVNAYYNPLMNDMNFPAGILQPPLFDPKMDDAPNYGNTGGTIGHELVHGFDDEGRKFDAEGNLKEWWTEADGQEFERRAQCVVGQYARYTIVDDIKINSRLTLGEDVADLGGLIIAWEAWKSARRGQTLAPRDGFTPEQRFFIGFGQWTCENDSDEAKRVNAVTNPHSPGPYRINGVVVNMPEFAQAFACRAGQPMVKPPEEICRIW